MTKHPVLFSAVVVASLATGLTSAKADEVWSAPPQPAESFGVSKSSGLSFGAGLGYQTPVAGLQLAYDVRLPDSHFTLAPWVGYSAWKTLDLFGSGGRHWHDAFAGGMMIMYGAHHRLVVDVAVAPVHFETNSVSSCVAGNCTETETPHVTYGPTAAIGYEYLASGGFFVRPMFGANLHGPIGQISLGVKFW